jgi:4a-hydroxytetrahydrobiopterin dehydratase
MTMSEMALNELQVQEKLKALNGWERRRKEIFKVFTFKDFDRTMAFVNAIAWISQRENHHPDLEVGYNRCVVRYSTHSAGGLTDNDFLCAAKIEKLMGL